MGSDPNAQLEESFVLRDRATLSFDADGDGVEADPFGSCGVDTEVGFRPSAEFGDDTRLENARRVNDHGVVDQL